MKVPLRLVPLSSIKQLISQNSNKSPVYIRTKFFWFKNKNLKKFDNNNNVVNHLFFLFKQIQILWKLVLV